MYVFISEEEHLGDERKRMTNRLVLTFITDMLQMDHARATWSLHDKKKVPFSEQASFSEDCVYIHTHTYTYSLTQIRADADRCHFISKIKKG